MTRKIAAASLAVNFSRFEDSMHFRYPWAHEGYIRLCITKPVVKSTLLVSVTPEHFIVPVAVKGRVNVN
jgi:hypothetical protein